MALEVVIGIPLIIAEMVILRQPASVVRYCTIHPYSFLPFLVEDLLLKLQELQSAMNTGKDSL